jgi:hypothetical protein
MKTEVKYYQSRIARIGGTSYRELHDKARAMFHELEILTGHRTTYVRSAYFNKRKIFLKPHWNHLYDKTPNVRKNRLVYYAAAIDLMKNSRVAPTVREMGDTTLYRFYGITKDKSKFVVQIKDEGDSLYHMSVFPSRS